MSIELIGIENENEFYPAGFFSGALEGELSGIVGRWKEADNTESPVERLAKCVVPYRDMITRVRALSDKQLASELRREASNQLISALGYDYQRKGMETELEGHRLAPSIARVANADGRDILWVLEAPLPDKTDWSADPLSAAFQPQQFTDEEREYAETGEAIEQIMTKGIFAAKYPPRYVILLGLSQLILIDRQKWPSRAVLRFELDEIFDRHEKDTLSAMACFLAREARAPETGIPLADRLEEEAQRHANAVTSSLKKTVRDAIEILGQEVLDVTEGKYPSGPRKGVWIEGKDLSLECLRYMYRLLFLFYAEANPKLNVLDIKGPVYATGYSLEALRELESVRLRTKNERDGTYLWASLQRLLGLMYSGTNQILKLPAVKVSLLDPDATPILSNVQLRNEAIQKIIRLLSLKKTKHGTTRISYAQLGIGQLGAVYETLISFTGFVAKTDLIELRPQSGRGSASSDDADQNEDDEGEDVEDEEGLELDDDEGEEVEARVDKIDLLAPSYFVARSRAQEFKPEEIVYAGPEPRIYPKGTFVYRLAGRDREKSASYYTPEPLARLLVKHALMERCKDMPADEILELKVLEPAMGSAAFLVETTNQLADLYLERKQQETGQTIAQEDYFLERQKVRAFIADRNCFGVDLNPVAVELGAISLWLNSLHNSDFSPWFGDQLHAGNSLIGARRASYDPRLMVAKKKADLWFNEKPTEIGWNGKLPEGHIWQFLLPAKDMAKFDSEKTIEEFAGEAQQQIKDWRKGGFFEKLETNDIMLLQKLSHIAEDLFDRVAQDLAKSRAESNDAITLWPAMEMSGTSGLDFKAKEHRIRKLIGADHASNTLPYKRLKTAMDAWCALWLWPLDKASLLPSRREFLHGLAMILEGGFLADGSLAAPSIDEFADPSPDFMGVMDPGAPATNLFEDANKRQKNLFRETNVDALIEEEEWLKVAVGVAARERFAHFDLIFADVLKERGGFDVIVGNPPWARPHFDSEAILGDIDPKFAIRKMNESERAKIFTDLSKTPRDSLRYIREFVSSKGLTNITGSFATNPFVGQGKNNLYRCFVDLAFRQVAPKGFAALIHQDGHLTDPKSGDFRREWYGRIAKHFEFSNKMTSKNFAEVHDELKFSLNIYRGGSSKIYFEKFTNAFLPSQIEESYIHDATGAIPAIKNEEGNWDTRGHRDRIVLIDGDAIAAIHGLTETHDVPVTETRFLQPYSAKMLRVFQVMSVIPSWSGKSAEFQVSHLWDETKAKRKLKTIRVGPQFVATSEDGVLTGPSMHVGNSLYKSPRQNYRSSADYEVIDLELIGNDYLPRYLFVRNKELSQYRLMLPRCDWDSGLTHVDSFRLAMRQMNAVNGERSLIPSLVAPGPAHLLSVVSVAFKKTFDLLQSFAMTASLPYDGLVKILGQHLGKNVLELLPWADVGQTAMHRGLRLACLTSEFGPLWNEHADLLEPIDWHSSDHRLALTGPIKGPKQWDRSASLRTDFARRMALVEIDVLVAQALGLTLDQLVDLYRIYFPVLQQNEAGTWYDQKGKIVWTCSKGLPGVGYLQDGKSPSRKSWKIMLASGEKKLECEAVIDFLPGGPQTITRTFEGPFDQCDRIEDYKRAWAYFEDARAKGLTV